VRSGVCPGAFTNTLTVQPAPLSQGGTVSGASLVCAGNGSLNLSVSGNVGSVQQWESSLSGSGLFAPVSGATTSILQVLNLTQTTFFRAIIQSANCAPANSNTFAVVAATPAQPGTILGTSTLCPGPNSGTLQLINHSGTILQWQTSLNGISWSSINSTLTSVPFVNLNSVALFRAVLQNSPCPMVYSSAHTVNLLPAPTVTFEAMNACALSALVFTNNSTGATQYSWDFGDSFSASGLMPSHTYSTSGTYTVKLYASSSQGCSDSLKKVILIYPLPTASLVSSDTTCYGMAVQFINASSISSGSIQSISLGIGGGGPQITSLPYFHQFQGSGSHSVTLSATSGFGCQRTFSKTVQVFPKPNALFTVKNVCEGASSQFNNLSTITSGLLKYNWSFGDGGTSTLVSPQHLYNNAFTYLTRLICSSDHNCRDTAYFSTTVNARPTLSLSAYDACQGTQTSFYLNNNLLFTPTNHTFLFGDGSAGSFTAPVHTYSQSGIFTGSLTYMTDSGCVSMSSHTIKIFPKPTVFFTVTNVCEGDSSVFNSSSFSDDGPISLLWNSTAGISDTLPSWSRPFPAGQHTVTLNALSSKGCANSAQKPFIVFHKPQSLITFTNYCDNVVQFKDSSISKSGSIISYKWDFDDHSYSPKKDPQHHYKSWGSYDVSLITETDRHCSDTLVVRMETKSIPHAAFKFSEACLGTSSNFSNTNFNSSIDYTSHWEFGDGKTSTQESGSHIYASSGSYLVQLIVNSYGCKDTVTSAVRVYSLPKINAGRDTIAEQGKSIQLKATGTLTYSWTPAILLDNYLISNPNYIPQMPNQFVVWGQDENGCINRDTLFIDVKRDFEVTPYNLVTPDGNGMNDKWEIKNIVTYPENHVLILDSSNQVILDQENYSNTWDGRNKHGEMLPDGTYYYILSFKESDRQYKGFITLIRNQGR
jgi:gliding motility-associated-like protein